MKFPSVVVHLRDGRQVDVTGLSPAEASRQLLALGVRRGDIASMVHGIPRAVPLESKKDRSR